MSGNKACTVYVGNIDERVSEKVLYDILVQAGRIIDLYIPQDKETNQRKGFAFAEYETEEIAEYAVRLFSDIVTLNRRTLKFGVSGKKDDPKPLQNQSAQLVPNIKSRNGIPKPRSPQLKKTGISKRPCRSSAAYHPYVVPKPSSVERIRQSDRYDYNRRHLRNQTVRRR